MLVLSGAQYHVKEATPPGIEPRLISLKSRILKEGKISPVSLLRLLDEVMEETEEPAVEVQVIEKEIIVEKEVEKIVTKEVEKPGIVPKVKLAESQAKFKEKETIVINLQQQISKLEKEQ